ncbi:MAG: APC family permease [Candidatus Aenigmarchaeota archaeon]|nr:APC family permease [Candidatus Aenigmarchaeota archaeon]
MPEGLKRALTFKDIVILGVAIIIGAGIYSIIGKAVGIAGYSVWISVIFAGIVTCFTGLSFAEMTSIYPKTYGYFKLIKTALESMGGKVWGFVVQWILVLACIFAIATISLAFGGYFSSFIYVDRVLAAILVILFSAFVSYIGIKESVSLTIIFSIVEILGLIVVIVLGIFFLRPDVKVLLEMNFDYNVIYASSLIFFAFTGFELIPAQAEETQKAERFVPKAIVTSILICTLIYCLVSIAVTNLLEPSLLETSQAPLVDAVSAKFGSNFGWFLWICAIISIVTTVLGVTITSSRLAYGLAKEKLFPVFLAKISKRFKTPSFSILTIALLSALSTFIIKDLKTTAEIANFLTILTFYLVNISVIVLRWTKPKIPRSFKVPFNFKNTPLPSLIASIFCMFLLFHFPFIIVFNSILIIVIGVVFYFLTREKYFA